MNRTNAFSRGRRRPQAHGAPGAALGAAALLNPALAYFREPPQPSAKPKPKRLAHALLGWIVVIGGGANVVLGGHAAADSKYDDVLDENVSLTDWDVAVSGIDAVVEANQGIWKAVPAIRIVVKNVVAGRDSRAFGGPVATCEISVELNDDAKTVLTVVDVIDVSNQGKIKSVRAYKQ